MGRNHTDQLMVIHHRQCVKTISQKNIRSQSDRILRIQHYRLFGHNIRRFQGAILPLRPGSARCVERQHIGQLKKIFLTDDTDQNSPFLYHGNMMKTMLLKNGHKLIRVRIGAHGNQIIGHDIADGSFRIHLTTFLGGTAFAECILFIQKYPSLMMLSLIIISRPSDFYQTPHRLKQNLRFFYENCRMNIKRAFLILIVLLSSLSAQAQRPAQSGAGFPSASGSSPQAATQQQNDNIPDTVGIHRFFADDPAKEQAYADTLLHHFQQYDPARQRDYDYLTTGNAGGAARYIAYQPGIRNGLDIGFHQYDIYRTPAAELPFYRLQKAFTNLGYFQQGSQADSYLTAQFARNFADLTHLSIDYKRLSHIGTQGQYANQNSRHTALATGIWLRRAGGRYQGFISVAANTNEQEDNGGLRSEPEGIPGRAPSPANATVWLNEGQTRYNSTELAYQHHWTAGGRPDSSGQLSPGFPLRHRITYTDARYKYFDPQPSAHTAFYGRFPQLLADERGIRYFIRHRHLENNVQLATTLKGKAATLGLTHSLNHIGQEVSDTSIQLLMLHGSLSYVSGSAGLRMKAEARLHTLGNAGDYLLRGELKLGSLRLEFINQLNAPTLVQHRFYLSQHNSWTNTFRKTLETGIKAQLALEKLRLHISGAYYLLNNYIYFDTTAQPKQTSIPLNILQISIRQQLRLGHFHLDNTLVLQQASEAVIRLPELFSKHSAYYEGKWFKVLQIRLGLDFRFNTPWNADYYNPVIGQYHLQDQVRIPFFPAADAFAAMKVGSFRAYLKFEGLGSMLLPGQYYYQSAYYAFPFPGMRFGVHWRLSE